MNMLPPMMLILYGGTVMAMLLGFRLGELSPGRQAAAICYGLAVMVGNGFAMVLLGQAGYGKFYLLFVQLPVYIGFSIFSRYRGVKLLFVLLSMIVFAAPPIMVVTALRTFYQIDMATSVGVFLVCYILMGLFIHQVLRPDFIYILENCESGRFWLFCLIPMLGYLYSYLRTGYNFIQDFEQSGYWVRQIPATVIFASYILLVRVFRSTREKQQLENEGSIMRLQLEAAKLYLSELKGTQEQATIYRHDMRHHINLLSGYAAEGSLGKIKDYLAAAEEKIDVITPMRYCDNETVNLILNAFDTRAEKAGVVLAVDAKLPEVIGVSDAELCTLLSNALENAIAAARLLEEPKLRRVYVRILVNGERLVLSTENAYVGEIEMDGELPKPKRDKAGHGLGMKSMTMLVERRGGLYSIDTSGGIFILRLVVPFGKGEAVEETEEVLLGRRLA